MEDKKYIYAIIKIPIEVSLSDGSSAPLQEYSSITYEKCENLPELTPKKDPPNMIDLVHQLYEAAAAAAPSGPSPVIPPQEPDPAPILTIDEIATYRSLNPPKPGQNFSFKNKPLSSLKLRRSAKNH
jgi:hypothetical protein